MAENLREKIAEVFRHFRKLEYIDSTSYQSGINAENNISECTKQILNLLKEELDKLTVNPDNPYFIVEKVGMDTESSYNKYPEFQVYEDGKQSQLSHTIKEIKDRLGVE